ncbi:hypothetical protein BH11BAC1_BH11BAC1_26890 [soil metagenome]
MKRFFFLFLFPLVALAQTDCDDPYRDPDVNHIITTDYDPVCGCNGKTYRNSDAAYWWGGINLWTASTICDDFDIDLYPNIIVSGATVAPHLRIYMKYPGTATLTIYNDFGKLMLKHLFSNSLSGKIIPSANPYDLDDTQTFPRGLYILIVTVGGEKKYKKILRVTE